VSRVPCLLRPGVLSLPAARLCPAEVT